MISFFNDTKRQLTGIISCFCRFEGVGIYVVMFWEIMKTLVRIVMLFIYLVLAFSLAFYALMLEQVSFCSAHLHAIG